MSCATCGSHKHHDIHRAPFGEKRKWEGSHPGGSITGTSHTFVTAPEKPETPEQIAERLEHCKDCGAIFVCSCGDGPTKPGQVLAALREVEARGEQRAAALGGALLDSAIERAEKAERDLRDIIENDEGQRERANKAEAERDECIEIAAKAIGSEYRNVGVVQALATWASQLQQRAEKAEAERDTMLDEEKRLEDFSDRMEHGFNEAQDELAEMRERAEKAEADNEKLRSVAADLTGKLADAEIEGARVRSEEIEEVLAAAWEFLAVHGCSHVSCAVEIRLRAALSAFGPLEQAASRATIKGDCPNLILPPVFPAEEPKP